MIKIKLIKLLSFDVIIEKECSNIILKSLANRYGVKLSDKTVTSTQFS